MEAYTVKTYLRPDYYEYFPIFSGGDLKNRLEWCDFAEATLLGKANIDATLRGKLVPSEVVKSFLNTTTEIQSQALGKILESVGISRAVASAMGKVRRHLFCPVRDVRFAYLNASITIDKFSCLSPPGLVALMLEQLKPKPGARFLEIGCGSTYHAHCLSEMLSDDCEICGLEINGSFLDLALPALSETNKNSIKISHSDAAHGWPSGGKFDYIYGAISIQDNLPEALLNQLVEGGVAQYARALSKSEFLSEPDHSWLRRTFASYQDYCMSWEDYSCLMTGCKKDGKIVELNRIYDVSFVPYRSKNFASEPPESDKFELLRTLV